MRIGESSSVFQEYGGVILVAAVLTGILLIFAFVKNSSKGYTETSEYTKDFMVDSKESKTLVKDGKSKDAYFVKVTYSFHDGIFLERKTQKLSVEVPKESYDLIQVGQKYTFVIVERSPNRRIIKIRYSTGAN